LKSCHFLTLLAGGQTDVEAGAYVPVGATAMNGQLPPLPVGVGGGGGGGGFGVGVGLEVGQVNVNSVTRQNPPHGKPVFVHLLLHSLGLDDSYP
jgi:hypothetical protein